MTGDVRLTPRQHWYFAVDPRGVARVNHLVLLRVKQGCFDGSLTDTALAAALAAICRHHESLRLSFAMVDGHWQPHAAAPCDDFEHRTLDATTVADPWPAIAAHAEANQPPAPASNGTLFKATHYTLCDAHYLLLAAHHLLVDAVSWRILVEDLGTALSQATAGRPILLPCGSASVRDWVGALASASGIARAERDRPYWESVALAPVTCGRAMAPHDLRETHIMTADLGPADASLPDRRVVARLLAGLGVAMRRHDGREALHVELAHHGRDPIADGLDASRTVGWLSANFPFLLDCRAPAAAIETALAAVPSRGVSWDILRWLSDNPIDLPEPEVGLNYLGSIDIEPDDVFVPSDRLPASLISGLRGTRLLDIEVFAQAGRLVMNVRLASSIASPGGIRDLLVEAMTFRLEPDYGIDRKAG